MSKWKKGDTIIYSGQPLIYGGRIIINPDDSDFEAAGYTKMENNLDKTEEQLKDAKAIKKEKLLGEQNSIISELDSLDYLTAKELDGEDMTEYDLKYSAEGGYKAHRRNLRSRWNELEKEIESL